MKSIKIKVQPLDPIKFTERAHVMSEELTWLWNEVRNVTLRNHAFQWYDWAEKRGPEIFGEFTLDGCIRVALNFDRNSAWIGASCPIATGGGYWTENHRKTPIQYKNKSGEIKTKPAMVLRSSGQPYRKIRPREHRYLIVNGVKLDTIAKFDSKKLLKKLRADVGLGEMTTSSDFIGGLLGQFEESWKAFLNVKQVFGKKPRYRKDNNAIETFYNSQKGPTVKDDIFTIVERLKLQPIDKNWKKRLYSTRETEMRSYQVVQEPSGLYLCISLATPEEALKTKLRRTVSKIKKGYGAESTEYASAKETMESLLGSLEPTPIEHPKISATIETYSDEALLKLDGGQLFQHNQSRVRVDAHINKLKSQLGKMRQANDRRTSKEKGEPVIWYERPATKNEKRLAAKIRRLHERSRNSRAHFNHKLSTRLARTYDAIVWVDGNANENENVRLDSIGDLKAGVKRKIEKKGGKFVVQETETAQS